MILKRTTEFSPCRKYRYTLWREWAKHQGDLKIPPFDNELKPPGHSDWNPSRYCMFIGLNPSTADEVQDDPTIRRCVGFAKAWGYGALCMTNLFAFRATDPAVMKAQKYPIGEFSFCAYDVGDMKFSSRNSAHIYGCAHGAGIVVAAWGTHGKHIAQSDEIRKLFKDTGLTLHHLGLNQDGTPKHPLYLSAKTKPEVWQ